MSDEPRTVDTEHSSLRINVPKHHSWHADADCLIRRIEVIHRHFLLESYSPKILYCHSIKAGTFLTTWAVTSTYREKNKRQTFNLFLTENTPFQHLKIA